MIATFLRKVSPRFVLCGLLAAGALVPAAAPAGPLAYVPSRIDDTVTVVDVNTRAVVATIPVDAGPFGITVCPVTRRVYVTNSSGTVNVIDSATQSVIATMPAGFAPHGIAVDPTGTRAWVGDNFHRIHVLDLVTNTPLRIFTATSAGGVAFSPDGNRVYVTNRGPATVTVFDAATEAPILVIPTGNDPQGIAVSRDGSRLYVANNDSDDVRIFDAATGALLQTLPVMASPQAIALNGDGTRLLVASGGGVEHFDLASGVHTVLHAAFPSGGVAFQPDGTDLYYLLDARTLAVLDAALQSRGNVVVPPGPTAFGPFVLPGLPEIGSATYDAASGVLTVTGTGFVTTPGAVNDVVANKLTFVGEGGGAYTLTDTANVEITSSTSFSMLLSTTDRAALEAIVNANGTASAGGTSYNLAAAEDWMAGVPASAGIADLTGNTVTASGVTFIVTPSAAANGTISPATPQTIVAGASGVFTLAPDFKFSAGPVGGTCTGTLAGNAFTTGPIHADCTVNATFVQTSFTATPSVGPNGTVAESAQTLAGGDTAVFNITPDPLHAPSVTGSCGGTLAGNTYTTAPLVADCSVIVSFVRTHFVITPSASANGSISPNTPQTLPSGTFGVFTVTPDAGYAASVGGTCGGSLAGNTYTTNVPTADCTVAATFSLNSYVVTPSAGANGTITPATPQTIAHGGTATFTVSPATGYTAMVGGTCGGTLAGTTYQTAPITSACTVVATFTRNTYTVTPSAGANGTITPATPQTIAHGATTTFTVTPAAGHSAVVGGTCGGALVGSTYTTAPITTSCTVAATFTAVTVRTYSGPSATGSGTITATFTGGAAGCTYTRSAFIPVAGGGGSPPSGTAPAGVLFPHGLFDFAIGGCVPGDTVTMTISFPTVLAPGTSYWKYGPTPGNAAPHWYVLPATIAGNTATFTIADGGLGDDDLAANGTIVDQGGPGSPAALPEAIPTMSEWMMLLMGSLLLISGWVRVRREPVKART